VTVYERIGQTYAATRVADPRIAVQIHDALGDARTILNVGAGTGNYEPTDRSVIALDPSTVMLAQRAPDAAPAVRASSAAVPFGDGAFEASLAILTVHHWLDLDAGIAEMRRVSVRQVLLVFEPLNLGWFWLVDYFPEMLELPSERRAPSVEHLVGLLPGAEVVPVLVPSDCTDGFGGAFWNRPERYLDPEVQRNTSNLSQLAPEIVARGSALLRRDLEQGVWDERYGNLRGLDAFEMGYRLIVALP
jgi:Methyltransferase domain